MRILSYCSSGMQKGIRRGQLNPASKCALRLIDMGYDKYTTKRLTTTAAEDIGIANTELVKQVIRFSKDWWRNRESWPVEDGTRQVPDNKMEELIQLIAAMCNSEKNRSMGNMSCLMYMEDQSIEPSTGEVQSKRPNLVEKRVRDQDLFDSIDRVRGKKLRANELIDGGARKKKRVNLFRAIAEHFDGREILGEIICETDDCVLNTLVWSQIYGDTAPGIDKASKSTSKSIIEEAKDEDFRTPLFIEAVDGHTKAGKKRLKKKEQISPRTKYGLWCEEFYEGVGRVNKLSGDFYWMKAIAEETDCDVDTYLTPVDSITEFEESNVDPVMMRCDCTDFQEEKYCEHIGAEWFFDNFYSK